MEPALAVAEAVQGLGVVAAVAAASGALLLPGARARASPRSLALALTPVLLVGELWDAPQVESLRVAAGRGRRAGGRRPRGGRRRSPR